ncbi:hypothetical protein CMV_026987 [Castanea mollissima]|uniref:Uncharacterized protein n=1 Tax=Castanea mollissima TaxID=60419 RepID=A0A8J4QKN2_9ROSI|nr:hypothetical protein CMV_026987 [Castanea mollissima]
MPALSTMDILILRAHEWRADFFAPLYSARTVLQLKCRFIIKILAAVSDGCFPNSCLQRVRIPSNRGASSAIADLDEEGRDSGGASAAATRGRAITLAVRKGLIQKSIPIGYLKVITAPS